MSQDLFAAAQAAPLDYDAHTRLLAHLKEDGAASLEEVRRAHELMASRFPLSVEIWLSWLRDEQAAARSAEEALEVLALHERSHGDYKAVELYVAHGEYAAGLLRSMPGSVDADRVRAVFEVALEVVGFDVRDGKELWDAYRAFERQLCQEQQGADAEQTGRVEVLYARQLAIPLLGMEATMAELESDDAVSAQAVLRELGGAYEAANEQLRARVRLEDGVKRLGNADPETVLATWSTYLDFEARQCRDNSESEAHQGRAFALFERAVRQCCLYPQLWDQYVSFCESLGADELALSVCRRALRNCPLGEQLWIHMIELEETCGNVLESDTLARPLELFKDTNPAAAAQILVAFCHHYRRTVPEAFAETVALVSAMAQDWEGDARAVFLDFRASTEDGAAAIETMLECARASPTRSKYWLKLTSMMRYGATAQDPQVCHAAFEEALQQTGLDWIDGVVAAWLEFEEQHGTLEGIQRAKRTQAARTAAAVTSQVAVWRKSKQQQHNKRQKREKNKKEDKKKKAVAPEPVPMDVDQEGKGKKVDQEGNGKKVEQGGESKEVFTVVARHPQMRDKVDVIRALLEECGTIKKVRRAGRAKTAVFVEFQEHKCMQKAILLHSGTEVAGGRLELEVASAEALDGGNNEAKAVEVKIGEKRGPSVMAPRAIKRRK